MAVQMARLLADSDLDELREVVRRWTAEATSTSQRGQYERFGARLVELKQALREQPVQPTHEELELALTMMIELAARADPQAFRP